MMTTSSKNQPIQDEFMRVPRVIQRMGGVSRSYWWQGVKDGRFPPGIKLSSRVTVWRASDIDALIASFGK
jgi:prophage regulatory protein